MKPLLHRHGPARPRGTREPGVAHGDSAPPREWPRATLGRGWGWQWLGVLTLATWLGIPVRAATVSWVGPLTGTHDWSAPSNWEGGRLPAAGDDVRIAGESTNLVVRVLGAFSVRSVDSTATLRLTTDITVNSVLTVSGTFLNRGIIRLESERSDRNSTLALTGAGGLDNRGLLWVTAANSGGRRLNGGISNRGRILVESGITLNVANDGRVFSALEGRIDANGLLLIEAGRVQLSGGLLAGDVRAFNAATVVDASWTSPATLRLVGVASSLIGNASPAATLALDTDIANNVTLTTAPGAVNLGRIVLGSSRSDRAVLLAIGAGFTNAPSGVIEAQRDAGGSRSINGTLVNQGLLSAPDTTFAFEGTYHSDGGRVTGDVRFLGARILSSRPPAETTALALYGATSFESTQIPANLRLRVISDIGANGRLMFNTNLINSGAILLESLRSDRVSALQLNAFHLENRGLLRVVSTNGGQRRIEGRLTNRGQLTVDAGIHLVVANRGQVFSAASGAVTVDGSMGVDEGRVEISGGGLSGDLRLYNAATFVAATFANNATLRLLGTASTLVGNGSSTMTLLLDTDVGNQTTVSTLPGAVNVGQIQLSSSRSDRTSRLEFGAGFTNAPSGVIEAVVGAGGGRNLNGTLINQGQVRATGITLAVTGTYQSDGGSVSGDVVFQDARIVPTRVTPEPVELRLFGGGSVLATNNLPNLVLRVISDIGANGRLLFLSNVVNGGTILLESLRPDRTTTLTSANGLLVNGEAGLIVSVPDNAGVRSIAAALRNQGRIVLNHDLTLAASGAQHINSARLDLGGKVLSVVGSSLLNAQGGRLIGAGGVSMAGGPFTNAGLLAPGASPGRLLVTGNFVQADTGGLEIEVASTAGVGTGHDAVVIENGTATLQGGTLVTRLLGEFVPAAEARFRVISASGTVSGRFARTPSLQVHPNRYFQTEYLPNAIDLRTLTGLNSTLPPSIVVHPQSQTAAPEASIVLTVGANGSGPLSYQWRRNGVAIPGATGVSLNLPRLTEVDFGTYDVVVSNAAGSSTSDPASLAKTTSGGGGGTSNLDYGDAQDPLYPTTLAHNGASQLVYPGFVLGGLIDADNGTQQNTTATADGADEDGVIFLDPVVPGQPFRVQVTHAAPAGTAPGRLSAWIDWSANNSWAEAGDRIITHYQLARGINLFTNTVPANAVIGFTSTRFRLYRDNYPGFDGAGTEDGEVEDYRIEITTTGGGGGGGEPGDSTRDFGDAPDSYQTLQANDGPRHLPDAGLYFGNRVDLEPDGQPTLFANGDDSLGVPDDEDG
ncbi:MAG: immunoglobulin domain-containing protein, partial [Verrucomicrobiales bacterium]|nr:immunoglobulin domain-containing protein [Verrucomicrobiales bacterium]